MFAALSLQEILLRASWQLCRIPNSEDKGEPPDELTQQRQGLSPQAEMISRSFQTHISEQLKVAQAVWEARRHAKFFAHSGDTGRSFHVIVGNNSTSSGRVGAAGYGRATGRSGGDLLPGLSSIRTSLFRVWSFSGRLPRAGHGQAPGHCGAGAGGGAARIGRGASIPPSKSEGLKSQTRKNTEAGQVPLGQAAWIAQEAP